MSTLSPSAKAAIRARGRTIISYVRAHWADGRWRGDSCGCPDDRCTGHHHDPRDDCRCLHVTLDRLSS